MRARRILEVSSEHMEALRQAMIHPDVIVAYLHGSYAEGYATKLSDLDIAVLFKKSEDRAELFDLQMELMGRVMDALHFDDVDLKMLNDAPLLFQYLVVKNGKPIYIGDEEARVNFEAMVLNRYLDLKPMYDLHREAFFERVLAEGEAA